jgi:hypothetical protein
MTRRAADACVDVNAVIEINKVRQNVHTIPSDRLMVVVSIPNWRKHWTRRENLAVTIHTDFDRGHSGEGRVLYRRVTIAAIDSIVADVMLVAERHWLIDVDAHAGRVRGTHEQPQHQEDCRKNKN